MPAACLLSAVVVPPRYIGLGQRRLGRLDGDVALAIGAESSCYLKGGAWGICAAAWVPIYDKAAAVRSADMARLPVTWAVED